MRQDELERTLRDALCREVEATAARLTGLEDRVIADLGDRAPRLGVYGWLRRLLAPSPGARWAQAAILGATAAVFLIVGFWIGAERAPSDPADLRAASRFTAASAPVNDERVLFVLPALNAKSVSVVGSFSDWEAVPLADEDGDGIWTARLPLPPGRYEYAFVIDGRWWGQDPLADGYVKSFGEYSSVRYVGGGGDGA